MGWGTASKVWGAAQLLRGRIVSTSVISCAQLTGLRTNALMPAFWPWVEVLRGLTRNREPDELRRQLGYGAPWMTQLLPEIRDYFGVSIALITLAVVIGQ